MISPTDDNLIRLMLQKSAPKNTSKCRDCRLFEPTGAYDGWAICKYRDVVRASGPSCYKAQF